MIALCFFDDFADRHAAEPNFNLVNKDSLEKILKAEVFVNTNGQLRVAHLILGYTSITLSFQAPKYVIKAKDPRLHRISVVVHSFLLPEGVLVLEVTFTSQPILEGTFTSQPIPKGVPKVAFPPQHTSDEATSSQPSNKEEDEEEERQKEVVDVSDSDDLYKFFNQPLSPEISTSDLGQIF